MSMHQIEALIECSVRVLAAARPAPADARDLCYSLYELQDQFDCGYTVLRVPEELEQLGYLRRLPPERLPEPERGEALTLTGEGGFLEDSSYFDGESGLVCVTAGSPLWEKLCREGILPETDAGPVRELSALEAAERIAALAAVQATQNANEAMGLWYALYPALRAMESEDEEPSPRELALRDHLAAPAAFAAAAQWGMLPSPDELGECDVFEERWMEPYAARCKDAEVQRRIQEAMRQEDFVGVYALLDKLEKSAESTFIRAVTIFRYHQQRAAGEGPNPADGMPPLREARDGFRAFMRDRAQKDSTYCVAGLSLTCCLSMLGEYEQAFAALCDTFAPGLETLRGMPDGWELRFSTAALAISFYCTLKESIPDGAAEKQPLLRRRVSGLPTAAETRETLRTLMAERPEETWRCRHQLGLCLLFEGDPDGARRELQEADRLHPGDPEIAQALAAADEIRGEDTI